MWQNIKDFFHDSETIFLARLEMFIGALASFISVIDPNLLGPLLPPEYVSFLPWIIFLHGVALEYLRRRREEDPVASDEPEGE